MEVQAAECPELVDVSKGPVWCVGGGRREWKWGLREKGCWPRSRGSSRNGEKLSGLGYLKGEWVGLAGELEVAGKGKKNQGWFHVVFLSLINWMDSQLTRKGVGFREGFIFMPPMKVNAGKGAIHALVFGKADFKPFIED